MTELLRLGRRATALLDKVEISNYLCDLERTVRSDSPRPRHWHCAIFDKTLTVMGK
jgi:hypothetical protein